MEKIHWLFLVKIKTYNKNQIEQILIFYAFLHSFHLK